MSKKNPAKNLGFQSPIETDFNILSKKLKGYMKKDHKHSKSASINTIATKTYINYSNMVISERAIPDLRDGFKPVHRRILYSMLDLNLSYSGSHKKSARIVGDCIGKYHPHGDTSVYEAMVGMSQDWKYNKTFIDGQGNWGSIDGDNPAAMRYCVTKDTLIRLSNNTLIKIGDISSTNKEENINLKVLSAYGKINKVNKFFNSGKHDIYKMVTEEGYEISGSVNHPVVVLHKNINGLPYFIWKELSNLKENDYIVIDKTIINNNDKILSRKDSLRAEILARIIKNDIKYSKNELDILFKGCDITIDIKGSVFNDNKYRLNNFIFKNVKDKELFKDKELSQLINISELPNFLLESTIEVQRAFLSYLILDKSFITLMSIKTLKQLQVLLLNIGRVSKITKLNGKYKLQLLECNEKTKLPYLNDKDIKLEDKENVKKLKGYFYSKVKTIKKLKNQRTVYSIRVDSNCHSFIANGLINHNTEARFTKFGASMFSDIKKNVVDFQKNYDGSEKEPTVLPVPVPNILINGVPAGSIAVGMASSILPHNPTEVMESLRLVISNRRKQKETSAEDILKIIKAPDFPTGGIVYNVSNMLDIIKNGKGSLKVRSKHHIEKLSRGRSSIVITEIPFMKKKSVLINELVLLKKNADKSNKLLYGITDIRDESNKEGIRVVIDIKSGWDAEVLCNYIYKETNFDTSLSYFSVVIDRIEKENGSFCFEPREYGILTLLERYLDFRVDIITRKWEFIQKETKGKIHILEALLTALNDINKVIEIIKGSKKSDIALKKLIKEYNFSKEQGLSILNIKLSKLTGLEIESLENDKKRLEDILEESIKILSNEDYKYSLIDKNVVEVSKFVNRERKTEIRDNLDSIDTENLIPKEDCLIYVTHKGYVKRVSAKQIERQNRGTQGKRSIELTEGDFVNKIFDTNSHSILMFIMNNGQVYSTKAFNIPDSNRGSYIDNVFDTKQQERIVNVIDIEDLSEDKNLVMVTSKGFIKQTKLSEYKGSLRKFGINGINLKEGEVISTNISNGNEDIIIATNSSKSIRFNLDTVAITSRSTQGVTAIKLKSEDFVIGSGLIKDNDNTAIITITENGQAKVSLTDSFKTQRRAGTGAFCMQLSKKSGKLVSIVSWELTENSDLISITEKGVVNRIGLSSINPTSRATKGVKLMELKEGDKLVNSIKGFKLDKDI